MVRLVQSPRMARFLRPVLLGVAAALISGGCSSLADLAPTGPTPTFRPTNTSTSLPATATQAPTLPATADPGPSPTPFQHVVRSGETLLQIAALYGISLDDLLAINPGVSPQLLSIGQQLMVPGPGGEPLAGLVPSPTPVPLGLDPPACYRRPSIGVWCLTAVHNLSEADLENLTIEFRLDPDGESNAPGPSQTVLAPLNLMPAGSCMPVAAAFPDATGEEEVSVRVLSVLPASELEARYRKPEIQRSRDERQENGLSWRVEGSLSLPLDAAFPNRTLLMAVALDDRHRVVGYVLWEPLVGLAPGETALFAVRVFSLGPPIARIELQAEFFALLPSLD